MIIIDLRPNSTQICSSATGFSAWNGIILAIITRKDLSRVIFPYLKVKCTL